MANDEAKQLAEQIVQKTTQIAELDVVNDLVQTKDLGERGDFSDWRELFEEVMQFAELSVRSEWQRASLYLLREINNHVDSTVQAIGQIRQVGETGPENINRAQLASELENRFDALKQNAIPVLGYLAWISSDAEDRQQALARMMDDGISAIEDGRAAISGSLTEAEQLLEGIRGVSAQAGVSHQERIFRDAAKRYEFRSLLWLGVGALLAAATITAAVVVTLVWEIDSMATGAELVQAAIARLTVVGMPIFITLMAGRLYRSHSHLAVVNLHRADALRAFQAFVGGSQEPEVRDRVLLAATQAAFGQTPSGLIGDKGDRSSTVELIEWISSPLSRGHPEP